MFYQVADMETQSLCEEAQAKAPSTFNQLKSVHKQFQKLLQQATLEEKSLQDQNRRQKTLFDCFVKTPTQ